MKVLNSTLPIRLKPQRLQSEPANRDPAPTPKYIYFLSSIYPSTCLILNMKED